MKLLFIIVGILSKQLENISELRLQIIIFNVFDVRSGLIFGFGSGWFFELADNLG